MGTAAALRGKKFTFFAFLVSIKHKLQIQGRMQIFENFAQKALNHDLTLPKAGNHREIPESSGIFENEPLCVELWPKQG